MLLSHLQDDRCLPPRHRLLLSLLGLLGFDPSSLPCPPVRQVSPELDERVGVPGHKGGSVRRGRHAKDPELCLIILQPFLLDCPATDGTTTRQQQQQQEEQQEEEHEEERHLKAWPLQAPWTTATARLRRLSAISAARRSRSLEARTALHADCRTVAADAFTPCQQRNTSIRSRTRDNLGNRSLQKGER